MATLNFNRGPLAGQQVEVDREMTLGREGDLSIPDNEMSRQHARVRPLSGGIEVEDLGSTNGTWVNGTRVDAPTRLAEGAILELGESVASLEVRGAGGPAVVASGSRDQGRAPLGDPELPVATSGAVAYRPRPAATRLVGAQIATYLVIFAVAVALVLYFAMR